MEQKIEKKFFVFKIIAFELGVANSCNLKQDTWHFHSMCEETPVRFYLTLRETISRSTSLKTIKIFDKGPLMEIWQVFGKLSHVDCQSEF